MTSSDFVLLTFISLVKMAHNMFLHHNFKALFSDHKTGENNIIYLLLLAKNSCYTWHGDWKEILPFNNLQASRWTYMPAKSSETVLSKVWRQGNWTQVRVASLSPYFRRRWEYWALSQMHEDNQRLKMV